MEQKTPPKKVESRFQFVILAAKRARQLLKGAKPKIKTKSRNPIRIAQQEVKMGLVGYELLEAPSPPETMAGEILLTGEAGEELEGIPPITSLEEEEEEEEEEGLDKVYEEEEEEEEEEFEPPEKESEEE